MITAPLYSQNDPRWKNQRLGTQNGVTLGASGCAITALASADAANDPHNPWTPAQTDDYFTAQGGYVDGNGHRSPWESGDSGCCLLDWSQISQLLPNTNYAGGDVCQVSPAPVSKLLSWLDGDGQSAILEVRWNGNPKLMHFVLAVNHTDKQIGVMDPYDGTWQYVNNGRYGFGGDTSRAIYAIHYLKDTTPNVVVAPTPAPQATVAPDPTPVVEVPPVVEPPATTPTVTVPEYETSFVQKTEQRQILRDGACALDMTTMSKIADIPNGELVNVGGYFTYQGVSYALTSWAVQNGKWNGIAEMFFDPATGQPSGIPNVTVVPDLSKELIQDFHDALDKMSSGHNFVSLLISPLLKFLGRKKS